MKYEILAKKILATLKKNRVDFAVVGGYAWERNIIPSGTVDLDILVLSGEYTRMVKDIPNYLQREGMNTVIGEDPIMSLITVSWRGMGLELEVINSEYYSTRSKDFLIYTKQYRSQLKNGIYFADPELVWYMRLYLPDWRIYLYKCFRELVLAHRHRRYNMDTSNIIEISKVFKTERMIKPRVHTLRKYIFQELKG